MTAVSTTRIAERRGAGRPTHLLARRGLAAVGHIVSRWWAVMLVIVAWHVWVELNQYNSIVMPTPADVAVEVVSHPGPYVGPTLQTLLLAMVGIVGGMALGYALAVVSWASALLAGVVNPFVVMLRSVPIVALIPVVARLIGYGNKVVPVVTVMMAFFPAYVMTTTGLRSASRASVDIVRALGGTRIDLLRRVLVPASVPHILVAFRLVASSAILIAMVAEFLAGTSGLGRMFAEARNRFDAERAWGAAVVATILSVLLFNAALSLERRGRRRFS